MTTAVDAEERPEASAPAATPEAEAAAPPRGVAHSQGVRSLGLLIVALALGLTIVASAAIGAKPLLPLDVLRALFHLPSTALHDLVANGFTTWFLEFCRGLVAMPDRETWTIVNDLRVPRTIMAIVVGIGLGLSGALIQAMTRNPLADPGILGVNAGAAFFVVLGITVFGVTSISGYMWFAFGGALLVTVLVYVIGSAGYGPATPIRLTLAGVALGAVLQGITTAVTLLNPNTFDQMRYWQAGSVVGRPLELLWPIILLLAVGVICAAIAARPLNAVAMGDDLARSLGADVRTTRILVVVAVTLLAGGATALAGPVGFVGLMIPHIARWIVGPDQRWIMAYTLFLAPMLMLVSDIIGRQPGPTLILNISLVVALALGPAAYQLHALAIEPATLFLADLVGLGGTPTWELPVGIVTAFVGAPVLIILVRRRKASGL